MNIITFDDFLFERRSHYETNIDPTFEEFLQKIYERDTGFKNTYVSFRDSMHVTDINPNNEFNTPTGFYCYPLSKYTNDSSISEQDFRKLFPYASDRNYIHFFILRNTEGVLTNNTSFDKIIPYIQKIKYLYKDNKNVDTLIFDKFIESKVSPFKYSYNIYNNAHNFWVFIYSFASYLGIEKNKQTFFTNICNKIGIKGFIDNDGQGYIHHNEPTQAVFFKVKNIGEIHVFNDKYDRPYENNILSYLDKVNLKNPNVIKNLIKQEQIGTTATEKLFNNKDFNYQILDMLVDVIDWNAALDIVNLSLDFIEKYKKYLNWALVSRRIELTPEFIEKYKDFLKWSIVSEKVELTPEFIDKYKDYIYWSVATKRIELTPDNIEKYKDYLNWGYVTLNVDLTPEFIEKYKNDINWRYLIHKISITPEIAKKYKDYIDWGYYCVEGFKITHDILKIIYKEFNFYEYTEFIDLTPDILKDFAPFLNWKYVTKHIELTTEFIEKYKEYIDWEYASEHIELTDENVKKFSYYFKWNYIKYNETLSLKLAQKFKHELS